MSDIRNEIKGKLNTVFRDVFDSEDIEIFEEMTAKDVQEWDSLMHITLVVATEKAFNLRLNAAEIGKLENVGAMIDLIIQRTCPQPS